MTVVKGVQGYILELATLLSPASAGGEITKAARNWLAENLDASKRSQIMFIDRNDILNLYVVTNLPLPAAALPPTTDPWDTVTELRSHGSDIHIGNA